MSTKFLAEVTAWGLAIVGACGCGGAPVANHPTEADGIFRAYRSSFGLLVVTADPSHRPLPEHANIQRAPQSDRTVSDAEGNVSDGRPEEMLVVGTLPARRTFTVIGEEQRCILSGTQEVMLSADASSGWLDALMLEPCPGPGEPVLAVEGAHLDLTWTPVESVTDESELEAFRAILRAAIATGRVSNIDEDDAQLAVSRVPDSDLAFLLSYSRDNAYQTEHSTVLRIVRGERVLGAFGDPPENASSGPLGVLRFSGRFFVLDEHSPPPYRLIEITGDRVVEVAHGVPGY